MTAIIDLLLSAYFKLWLPALLWLAFLYPPYAMLWGLSMVLVIPVWLLWCFIAPD